MKLRLGYSPFGGLVHLGASRLSLVHAIVGIVVGQIDDGNLW